MAVRREKEPNGDEALVFDGFEQGIAASPHKGIANIQNANIATETGEALVSFSRTAQLQSANQTPVSGTLTASAGDGNYVLASDTTLTVGQWINVTASTVTKPATTATVNVLAVGGGGGSGAAIYPTNTQGAGGGGGGKVNATTFSVSATAYTISVGAGGTHGKTDGTGATAGGTSTITHVSGVTNTTDVSAAGGNGGSNTDGSGGGSGGTSGSAEAGGTKGASSGGGGGGDSAIGSNGNGGTGGNGGNGTASSISGASVTYGGGGGGGGNAAGGNAGSGGAGAGQGGTGSGTAGTANTGGGAGGAAISTGTTSQAGSDGGSGVVIISYTTGAITATGGTITTSGGNTIHTFTTSGTFTVTSVSGTVAFPTGNYFVDYVSGTKVKIASSYDPTGANPSFHNTSGTLSFTTEGVLGKPIAKASEVYNTGTTTQYRYYILDANGLVWVNDTNNSVGWVLTNPSTTYYGSQATPTGLAVLNGWVLVFAGELIFGKPTNNLGTAWTELGNDTNNNNLFSSTLPHFAYVGHQGRCYYTDGSYIGEIFPDITVQSTVSTNIQSYCMFTGGVLSATVSSIISGSGPQVPIGSSYRIPAAFFTDDFGTMPTGLTAGVVYWISGYSGKNGTFTIYGASGSTNTTLSGALSSGATSATLNASWTGQTMVQPVTFSNGEIHEVQFTNNSTSLTWASGLSGSATSTITYGNSAVNTNTGTGNLYFNTFYPIGSNAASGGLVPTMTLTNQRVTLPAFEIAQSMAEIGNTIIIGCQGNVVYPWNQVDVTPSNIISLPESNVPAIITVNQMAYIFAGHKGNIYITDGSTASLVIKVPDYCAGVPGSPATYVEPYYTWGDAAYIRGRVYFSILDQTSTKAGNCGGIWSFIPTQNLYIGQDTGLALRLQNQNSYGTYNGVATVILPALNQSSGNVLYWTGWYSDVTSPTYGIDNSNSGTNASFPMVIESDAVPSGSFINKKTFKQIEYKLSSPLDTGAAVTAKYRLSLTDSWTSCGTSVTDSTGLSGYFTVNFQNTQWLQLQLTMTPITSTATTNTFVRLKEFRIR